MPDKPKPDADQVEPWHPDSGEEITPAQKELAREMVRKALRERNALRRKPPEEPEKP